jgi:hypothetical protein
MEPVNATSTNRKSGEADLSRLSRRAVELAVEGPAMRLS